MEEKSSKAIDKFDIPTREYTPRNFTKILRVSFFVIALCATAALFSLPVVFYFVTVS